MRLGQFIAVLRRLPPSLPVGLSAVHSFRGYYDQVAFEPTPGATAALALEEAEYAVGHTFEGWKGGDYTMDESTMCWVADKGSSSDVTVGEYMTEILVGWLEEASVKR